MVCIARNRLSDLETRRHCLLVITTVDMPICNGGHANHDVGVLTRITIKRRLVGAALSALLIKCNKGMVSSSLLSEWMSVVSGIPIPGLMQLTNTPAPITKFEAIFCGMNGSPSEESDTPPKQESSNACYGQ
eukprot:3610475-Amphidinium_carterae.1